MQNSFKTTFSILQPSRCQQVLSICWCRWSPAVTWPGRTSSCLWPPRTPGRRGRCQWTPTCCPPPPRPVGAPARPPPSILTMSASHHHLEDPPGISHSRLTDFSSSLQTSKPRTSSQALGKLPPTPPPNPRLHWARGRPPPPLPARACTRPPARCTGAAPPPPVVPPPCQHGTEPATGRSRPVRHTGSGFYFSLIVFSTPLPRRNLNKIITKDSSERIRKYSINEVSFIWLS